MLDQKEADAALAALRRRRAEVEAWIEGPVKSVTLTAIDRMLVELAREIEVHAV